MGMPIARSNDKVNIIRKYLIHEPFLFLLHNFTSNPDQAYRIPSERLSIVGLPYPLR